jgi:hypothetical protein
VANPNQDDPGPPIPRLRRVSIPNSRLATKDSPGCHHLRHAETKVPAIDRPEAIRRLIELGLKAKYKWPFRYVALRLLQASQFST